MRAVHDYWRKHLTQRKSRKLIRGSRPENITNRASPLEDYVGENLCVFKYYDYKIFIEELRGLHPQATPSSACEQQFVKALQYTNNRMTNWTACRSLPIDEHYAGPQYYCHRFSKERVNFIPKDFVLLRP